MSAFCWKRSKADLQALHLGRSFFVERVVGERPTWDAVERPASRMRIAGLQMAQGHKSRCGHGTLSRVLLLRDSHAASPVGRHCWGYCCQPGGFFTNVTSNVDIALVVTVFLGTTKYIAKPSN